MRIWKPRLGEKHQIVHYISFRTERTARSYPLSGNPSEKEKERPRKTDTDHRRQHPRLPLTLPTKEKTQSQTAQGEGEKRGIEDPQATRDSILAFVLLHSTALRRQLFGRFYSIKFRRAEFNRLLFLLKAEKQPA